ncbi:MAG: hypothetical protein IIZ70_05035 [Kiritimatiellae bacterium]|nr:hypothetical protein [Kiritimatiellia bacterium]
MKWMILAATLSLQPLVSEDVLEPSVQNEVDHAIAMGEKALGTNVVEVLVGTNSLTATQKAIRLVSSQRSDGRWFVGTNDVTAVAVEILKNL